MIKWTLLISVFFTTQSFATNWIEPDWSQGTEISSPRENLYNLPDEEFEKIKEEGFVHTLKWPVDVTGLLIPYKPLKYFFEAPTRNPLKKFIFNIAKRKSGFKTFEELDAWKKSRELTKLIYLKVISIYLDK